jgi:hypothetical protein
VRERDRHDAAADGLTLYELPEHRDGQPSDVPDGTEERTPGGRDEGRVYRQPRDALAAHQLHPGRGDGRDEGTRCDFRKLRGVDQQHPDGRREHPLEQPEPDTRKSHVR